MTIKERRQYVEKFLTGAYNAGIMWANKSLDPISDQLRLKDIDIWCSRLGISVKAVERLAELGRIKEYRLTNSVNAARYYSKAEIHNALLTEQIATGFSGRFPEMDLTIIPNKKDNESR